MNIPTTTTITLCDAERFVYGLRELAIECNLDNITYNALGIIKYTFKDGTSVGGNGAWKAAGVLKT